MPFCSRERAEVVAAQARPRGMAAEQERRRELDPAARVVRLRRGARAEDDARREVLDLALAVDRRVRDDRDRLLKVVREVRARRERGERPVVAERADRLVARLDHERGHLQVVGLEAERRELALATDRHVVHLVGRRADLPAPGRADRLGRTAARQVRAEVLHQRRREDDAPRRNFSRTAL